MENNLDIFKEETVESKGINKILLENSAIRASTKATMLKLRLYHKWSIQYTKNHIYKKKSSLIDF